MFRFLIILLLPCQFYSQTFKSVKDTTGLKQKIESMSKSTNSIAADFIQEKT